MSALESFFNSKFVKDSLLCAGGYGTIGAAFGACWGLYNYSQRKEKISTLEAPYRLAQDMTEPTIRFAFLGLVFGGAPLSIPPVLAVGGLYFGAKKCLGWDASKKPDANAPSAEWIENEIPPISDKDEKDEASRPTPKLG